MPLLLGCKIIKRPERALIARLRRVNARGVKGVGMHEKLAQSPHKRATFGPYKNKTIRQNRVLQKMVGRILRFYFEPCAKV